MAGKKKVVEIDYNNIDYKEVGDVIMSMSLDRIRDLQVYLDQTYSVDLRINTPIQRPAEVSVGYAGGT